MFYIEGVQCKLLKKGSNWQGLTLPICTAKDHMKPCRRHYLAISRDGINHGPLVGKGLQNPAPCYRN